MTPRKVLALWNKHQIHNGWVDPPKAKRKTNVITNPDDVPWL